MSTMNFFTPFFADITTILEDFVKTSSANTAGYVNGATAVFATLSLIFLGLQLAFSASEFPVKKLLIMFATLAVVSAFATVPANYHTYISTHLQALPDDLSRAVTGTSMDIGNYLDDTIGKLMDGVTVMWHQGGLSELGILFCALLCFLACCALVVAAVIAILYAKVGLALVLALGPLFIFAILIPATKDFFTKWLSYALQFAIMQALIAAVMVLAQKLIKTYVMSLSDPTWALNDIIPIMAPLIVMIVLAYLFTQIPGMASSLSGGIGLSIGNVAGAAMSKAGQAAGVAAWAGTKGTAKGAWSLGKATARGVGSLGGGNSVRDARSDNEVTRGGTQRAAMGKDTGGPQREQPAQALTGAAAALDRIKQETESK